MKALLLTLVLIPLCGGAHAAAVRVQQPSGGTGAAYADASPVLHRPPPAPAEQRLALPPDPAERAKVGLAGVDSNRNGVRDDVEIHVVASFGASEKRARGLLDVAAAVQRAIVADNQSESMEAAKALGRAMECLGYIDLDDSAWKSVYAVAANTPERHAALRAHERRLSGQVFASRPVLQWRSSCTFDPDSLRD